MSLDARWRVSWGTRLTGLGVLAGVTTASVGLMLSGGAPRWTWVILTVLGVASAIASVANLGDRWHATDEGLSFENVLTARMGWPRRRHVAWGDIVLAVEHERQAWFLQVEGQSRWVLDHVDGHEHLRLVLTDRGVPMSVRERPRLFRRHTEVPR